MSRASTRAKLVSTIEHPLFLLILSAIALAARLRDGMADLGGAAGGG
ncbi:MAG: hypothetical protein PVI01_14770 [Gemmatimonadales bacterium]